MPSWTNVFFVLCSVLSPALCCDWVSSRFGHLSGQSMDLILQMGGPLTKDECPVPFPDKLYTAICKAQVDSQLVFVRDSLKLISHLYYHDNLTAVSWDNRKLEDFRSIIHRQVEELNVCVSPGEQMDRKLRNYYRRLTQSTLGRTGGSAASWELIREVTKRHLDRLDVMMNFIKESFANRRRNTGQHH
ncbi:interferon a3-like [Cheilinus undulatus]|uniref:interferon a3-like n=1 Tax=Cheilinus undulatus TaxID=241271 RepID=UPI001BD42DFB|nr:interferon a3-like [Cheilinus undulatus]